MSILLGIIFFGSIGFLAYRRLIDRRASWVDPINIPAPRRRFPWSWIILALGSTWLAFLMGRQPDPARATAPPASPARLGLAVGLPFAMVAAWLALTIARRVNHPYVRAARRAAGGDFDGAIAAIRAEMARHEAARPDAGAADARPDDPWAPPSVLTTDPRRRELANGWNALAFVEGERKDWAGALRLVEQAERTDPQNAPIYRGNRGGVLVELGRPDEAIPLLREALAALPASASWYRAVFLVSLAKALVATGHPAEAAPVLDHARHLGRGALVFPSIAKRQWRDRIAEVRARIPTPGRASALDPGAGG